MQRIEKSKTTEDEKQKRERIQMHSRALPRFVWSWLFSMQGVVFILGIALFVQLSNCLLTKTISETSVNYHRNVFTSSSVLVRGLPNDPVDNWYEWHLPHLWHFVKDFLITRKQPHAVKCHKSPRYRAFLGFLHAENYFLASWAWSWAISSSLSATTLCQWVSLSSRSCCLA